MRHAPQRQRSRRAGRSFLVVVIVLGLWDALVRRAKPRNFSPCLFQGGQDRQLPALSLLGISAEKAIALRRQRNCLACRCRIVTIPVRPRTMFRNGDYSKVEA